MEMMKIVKDNAIYLTMLAAAILIYVCFDTFIEYGYGVIIFCLGMVHGHIARKNKRVE